MEMTINRLQHSLAVAKKMKKIVALQPEKFECNADEAYLIGLLHDIGYEFSENQIDHAHNGGLFLKEQGYKYWREIYYHGTVQNEYNSVILIVLNYVDLTTGPNGESLSIEMRINDIVERYGKESIQALEAVELSHFVKNILNSYKLSNIK